MTTRHLLTWFYATYPQYQSLLFGAEPCTLMLITPGTGRPVGIEVKLKDHPYRSYDIHHQLEWGEQLIKAGGIYVMHSDPDWLKGIIQGQIEGQILDWSSHLERIYEQLNEGQKTIKF